MPIRLGQAKSNLLSDSNDKGDGRPYGSFKRVDSWFLNVNYNAAQHMRNASRLIESCGQNPADFAIRLA